MAELGAGKGTDYPGSLDTDATTESSTTFVRADVPNDICDAIIAIETELGTDPAGDLDTLKLYLQAEHTAADGTHSDVTFDKATGTTDAATVAVDTQYKDNIIKAWAVVSSAGAYLNSFGFDTATAITKATGKYTLTLSNAFTDANFATVGSAIESAAEGIAVQVKSQTTTTIVVETWDGGGNQLDAEFMITCIGAQN